MWTHMHAMNHGECICMSIHLGFKTPKLLFFIFHTNKSRDPTLSPPNPIPAGDMHVAGYKERSDRTSASRRFAPSLMCSIRLSGPLLHWGNVMLYDVCHEYHARHVPLCHVVPVVV